MSDERVCVHGGLRRQCEACDLAERLEIAERDLAMAWNFAANIARDMPITRHLTDTPKRMRERIAMACERRAQEVGASPSPRPSGRV